MPICGEIFRNMSVLPNTLVAHLAPLMSGWLMCCLPLDAEPIAVAQFPGVTSVKASLTAPGFSVTDILWEHTGTNWSSREWSELLRRYQVVVFPGGSGGEMFKRLGPGGQQAVKEFVSRGGGYLGICAGAWLASKLYLGLANIEGRKPWYVGVGGLEVAMEHDASYVFSSACYLPPGRRIIEMHNGPLWTPAPPDSARPACRVLASYTGATGTDKYGGDLFSGKPAIVTDFYGHGRVILFSPHPELASTNGNLAMIPEAVLWLSRTNGATRAEGDEIRGTATSADTAPRDLASYIVSAAGELPIIISAPHGGTLAFPGVPVRTGGKVVKQFAVARDVSTDTLAIQLSTALQRETGKAPSLVVARISRKYVDVNRVEQDAFESPPLREVYAAYHSELEKHCRQTAQKWGGGLLLDLHGQSVRKDSVFRGTRNGATTEFLVNKFGDRALTGHHGFQGLLEAQGFNMVPASDSDKKETLFNGGYITARYGLDGSYGIDAVQLEFGGVYTAKKTLPETANALARALTQYVARYISSTNASERRAASSSED